MNAMDRIKEFEKDFASMTLNGTTVNLFHSDVVGTLLKSFKVMWEIAEERTEMHNTSVLSEFNRRMGERK